MGWAGIKMKSEVSESFRLSNSTGIPMLWKIYNGVIIQKRNPRVETWSKEKVSQIIDIYSGEGWRDSPRFSGYVTLHDRYSATKGIPSSSESSIDYILKRRSIFHINTFVNIYNIVSALTGISMGAHDTDRISGDARLEFIREDMCYRMVGRGDEDVAGKGEYGYTDGRGILCRLDVKQSDRTKVTEQTHDVLVIFQGHDHMGDEILRQGVQLLDEAVHTLLVRHTETAKIYVLP